MRQFRNRPCDLEEDDLGQPLGASVAMTAQPANSETSLQLLRLGGLASGRDVRDRRPYCSKVGRSLLGLKALPACTTTFGPHHSPTKASLSAMLRVAKLSWPKTGSVQVACHLGPGLDRVRRADPVPDHRLLHIDRTTPIRCAAKYDHACALIDVPDERH